ncbi:hypothetical protein GCWU000246_01612 [Jonquetella anthropi E3_33 E1]|nr:hypothetical protein GCWU000246_01612 [Jonquetella anthropi E3_33 E1]
MAARCRGGEMKEGWEGRSFEEVDLHHKSFCTAIKQAQAHYNTTQCERS